MLTGVIQVLNGDSPIPNISSSRVAVLAGRHAARTDGSYAAIRESIRKERAAQAAEAMKREYADSRHRDEGRALPALHRADARTFGNGVLLPRQALFMLEPIDDLLPPLASAQFFQVDRRIPAGAASYSQPVRSLMGEAKIYGGGQADIPKGSSSIREEIRPIVTLVSSYGWEWQEELVTNYAGVNIAQDRRVAAHRAIEELENSLVWLGDVDHAIYGIANHPAIPKTTSAVVVNAASTASSLLDELNRWAGWAFEQSLSTMFPNQIVCSLVLHRLIMQKRFTSSASDATVARLFLEDQAARGSQPHIREIRQAWEMDKVALAAFGSGYEAALFYNDDPQSLAIVRPMEATDLPVQDVLLENVVPVASRFGGVKIARAGGNLLVGFPTA